MKRFGVFALLSAYGMRRTRWEIGILYALFSIGTLVVRAISHHATTLVPLWAATGFLWVCVSGSAMLLIHKTRSLRMPSIAASLYQTFLLLFAATVLLPAIVLWFFGSAFSMSLAQLTCAAITGVLLAQLPYMVYPLLWVIWVAIRLLSKYIDLPDPQRYLPRLPDAPSASLLWMLCVLLGALAAWRCLVLLRADPGKFAIWWNPVFLADESRALRLDRDRRGADVSSVSTRKFIFLGGNGGTTGIGPLRPVAAIRIFIDWPLAPQPWRSRAVQLAVWLGVVCFFARQQAGIPIAFVICCLPQLLVLVGSGRLQRLYQRQNCDLVELALLPGLGEGKHARQLLLMAVFQPIAIVEIAALLMLEAMAFWMRLDFQAHLLIVVSVVGMAVMTTESSIRELAGKSQSLAQLFTGVSGLGLLLMSFFFLHSGWQSIAWLLFAWIAFALIMSVGALDAWRLFKSRPHPFLAT